MDNTMNNNDDANNKHDATVVQHKDKSKASAPEETVVQAKPPAEEKTDRRQTLSTGNRDEALTRFYADLKGGENTEGFSQAKQIANAALAENKILLNKRFVLESVIGVGGMGTVYLAKDLRKIEANDLKPNVAVKVLNDNFKNHPDAFVTLQREASRSHTLSHPNIVTVHDFDRDGDVIFMTMEFLEGQPLDALIQDYPSGLPLERATKVIQGFCDALIHAHSKGIIHSDLKPGNIFVTDSSAKVLDFGIARSVSQTAVAGDFDAGSLGALTPAYATLEMFEGKEPHPSDDVYATAIIAYQILTGKHPYNNHSAQEAIKKGIKLVKPEAINKYQWQALESALALKRSERTPSIEQFLATFNHVKKVPYFKLLSGGLLVAVAALGYAIFSAPDEVALAIDNTYQKAEECAQAGNLDCAIEGSQAVLELAPKHAKAAQLLATSQHKKITQLEEETEQAIAYCASNMDLVCLQDALGRLKNLAPKSELMPRLQQKIDAVKIDIELSQRLPDAYNCLEGSSINPEDIQCAQTVLDSLLSIAPEDSAVLALQTKVAELTTQLNNASLARDKTINQKLEAANKCLNEQRYDCAITHSQVILQLDNQNTQALSIQQKANYDKKQANDNQRKADKLIQKATTCFNKKNYTCAIANSESALEFVPNYTPAKKMIKQSKQQIESLKNNFKIN